MAGKFYAVRVGRTPGIYLSWDECKKNVDGFSGPVYKSFKTRAEAEEFMGSTGDSACIVNSACTRIVHAEHLQLQLMRGDALQEMNRQWIKAPLQWRWIHYPMPLSMAHTI